MASFAAERIRAELFGAKSIPNNPVSLLDSISELREKTLSAGEECRPRDDVLITRCNVAGLSSEWILSSCADGNQATILILHGGGYIFGSCATHRNFASIIASSCHARVLVPEYRLAPEHKFPAPVEDAVKVYRELIHNVTDPRKLVVIGDSAGGGLCAALLLEIREHGLQMPAGAVLVSPWLDLTFSGKSYNTRARLDPMDRLPVLRRMAELYLGVNDPRLPLASPVFGNLRGLPEMLIQVGDHEVLLDDSRCFFEKAKKEGTRVKIEIWPEMWHDWVMSAPELPEANEAISHISAFVLKKTSEQPEDR